MVTRMQPECPDVAPRRCDRWAWPGAEITVSDGYSQADAPAFSRNRNQGSEWRPLPGDSFTFDVADFLKGNLKLFRNNPARLGDT